jgi:hypothetical protein
MCENAIILLNTFSLMWTQKNVERALFRWDKWKKSIVNEWYLGTDLASLDIRRLRTRSRQALRTLGLTGLGGRIHIFLEIYWICCVVSDYVFEDPSTYTSIRIPDWLATKYSKLVNPSDRILPPQVDTIDTMTRLQSTNNLEFLHHGGVSRFVPAHLKKASQNRRRIEKIDDEPDTVNYFETHVNYSIMIFRDDELYGILTASKGKPAKLYRTRKKTYHYPDRLAVTCSSLKDIKNMTYVQIADKFNLPARFRDFTKQSEVARYLVERGRRIISSVGLNLPISEE